MQKILFKVGELAKLAGLSVTTVRKRADEGIIEANRSLSNQRLFGEEAIDQLRAYYSKNERKK